MRKQLNILNQGGVIVISYYLTYADWCATTPASRGLDLGKCFPLAISFLYLEQHGKSNMIYCKMMFKFKCKRSTSVAIF